MSSTSYDASTAQYKTITQKGQPCVYTVHWSNIYRMLVVSSYDYVRNVSLSWQKTYEGGKAPVDDGPAHGFVYRGEAYLWDQGGQVIHGLGRAKMQTQAAAMRAGERASRAKGSQSTSSGPLPTTSQSDGW